MAVAWWKWKYMYVSQKQYWQKQDWRWSTFTSKNPTSTRSGQRSTHCVTNVRWCLLMLPPPKSLASKLFLVVPLTCYRRNRLPPSNPHSPHWINYECSLNTCTVKSFCLYINFKLAEKKNCFIPQKKARVNWLFVSTMCFEVLFNCNCCHYVSGEYKMKTMDNELSIKLKLSQTAESRRNFFYRLWVITCYSS